MGKDFDIGELAVWAADVGSVHRGNFGWGRAPLEEGEGGYETGTSIHDFAEGIAADLSAGRYVALGFECPLFVPITQEPLSLTKARPSELDRAWSASVGACALSTGLTECVWVFERLRGSAQVSIKPTFDWASLCSRRANLFIWEAFVTSAAKAATHAGDAELAVRAFCSHYPRITQANAVTAPNP